MKRKRVSDVSGRILTTYHRVNGLSTRSARIVCYVKTGSRNMRDLFARICNKWGISFVKVWETPEEHVKGFAFQTAYECVGSDEGLTELNESACVEESHYVLSSSVPYPGDEEHPNAGRERSPHMDSETRCLLSRLSARRQKEARKECEIKDMQGCARKPYYGQLAPEGLLPKKDPTNGLRWFTVLHLENGTIKGIRLMAKSLADAASTVRTRLPGIHVRGVCRPIPYGMTVENL
jgi:hypothetical protein